MRGSNLITLKGDNHVTWKYQVRMLLLRDDLYDIVTGDEQAPSSTDNQAVVSFRKRKQKSLRTITFSIDASQLHLVGEATDPKLLWEKLQSQFQLSTWANRLRIQERTFNLKLGHSDSIQDHIYVLLLNCSRNYQ